MAGGPPPLLPTGLLLGRNGRFTHEGQPIRHARLHAAFRRGVRYLDGEQAWVVQLGHFRGRIEIEDTPYFVDQYDVDGGALELSDGTRERLHVDTLQAGDGDVLRCTVKGRFPARFTHAAQAELLQHVELHREQLVLCARIEGHVEREELPRGLVGSLGL